MIRSLFLAAALVAGCAYLPAAATAPPQPTPQVVRVEVPGPQPTPEIITVTVDVPGPTVTLIPEACITALDTADAMNESIHDWIELMADGRWKKSDRAFDGYLDELSRYWSAADDCRRAIDDAT